MSVKMIVNGEVIMDRVVPDPDLAEGVTRVSVRQELGKDWPYGCDPDLDPDLATATLDRAGA
jgi:hypothetical protein